jgi:hypothetical protein
LEVPDESLGLPLAQCRCPPPHALGEGRRVELVEEVPAVRLLQSWDPVEGELLERGVIVVDLGAHRQLRRGRVAMGLTLGVK